MCFGLEMLVEHDENYKIMMNMKKLYVILW